VGWWSRLFGFKYFVQLKKPHSEDGSNMNMNGGFGLDDLAADSSTRLEALVFLFMKILRLAQQST
jgi:hypothetical protein